MTLPTTSPAAVLAALVAGACATDPGSVSQEIIGGSTTSGYPAVVMIESTSGLCTGTLVAPQVILTAAHCIQDSINNGTANRGIVSFGAGNGSFFADRPIRNMWAHRYYNSTVSSGYDIGFIRLGEDAPEEVELMPFNLEPLDDGVLGAQINIIGFGVTDGETQTGAGQKRQILLTVDELGNSHIGMGTPGRNICQGDSGGPSLLDIDGVETVIAVSSFGSNFCMDRSFGARTDSHAEEGLLEVLAAWSGPCQQDGECNDTTACGEFPDPDCDQCGFDGFCAGGCERLDLDCPLSSRPGEFCNSAEDCESRLCIASPEDERVKYCSQRCEPATTERDCDLPLTVCTSGEGGNVCRFGSGTPGIQGAPCNDGGDCRSGVCHSEEQICIEQCGGNLPTCREPFVCEEISGGVSACIPEKEGGCGCAARGGSGPMGQGAPLLLLAFAWLWNRSRKRR